MSAGPDYDFEKEDEIYDSLLSEVRFEKEMEDCRRAIPVIIVGVVIWLLVFLWWVIQ